jgi:hypothetical protein
MRSQKLEVRSQKSSPSILSLLKGGKGGLFGGLFNEKGIALVMVLVLSVIALAIMAGLIYMITTGTQMSGMQKRYKTALEAGLGGADITYQLIAARGDPNIPLTNFLITASNVGGVDCLTPKLNSPTSSWPAACSNSLTIDPNTQSTYDMRFDLGSYRAYAKIADTADYGDNGSGEHIAGNSGPDLGLIKGGVVAANTGEINVVSMPYLYTIEVDAENPNNSAERAKLSILYQY